MQAIENAGPNGNKRCGTQTALVPMSATLIVLTLLHDLDHVRQGRSLEVELYGVAVLALVTATTTLGLLLLRHPLSELAAAALGVSTVLGVGAVHVAPRRSLFSDSYSAARADLLSWSIIVLMMLVGGALAMRGLSAFYRRNRLRRR